MSVAGLESVLRLSNAGSRLIKSAERSATVLATKRGDFGRIAFREAGKTYATKTGSVAALGAVTLTIEPGSIFGIIGRSGAGKSTLIRLINGLERATSGEVVVDGVAIGSLDRSGLIKLRRRIGMIFQHFNLLSAKTVLDNVALPLVLAGASWRQARGEAKMLLDLVGLSEKKDAYPSQLSGGQKQRVGIARALISKPDILLCDEATSALDPETTRAILALLKDINRRTGITIVLITHEMAVIRQICDRIAVLEKGAIVEEGAVGSVFAAPTAAATRSLIEADRPSTDLSRVEPHRGVIEIAFARAATDINLAQLAEAMGPAGRILSADIRDGQGMLIISLSGPADADAIAARLGLHTASTRVLR